MLEQHARPDEQPQVQEDVGQLHQLVDVDRQAGTVPVDQEVAAGNDRHLGIKGYGQQCRTPCALTRISLDGLHHALEVDGQQHHEQTDPHIVQERVLNRHARLLQDLVVADAGKQQHGRCDGLADRLQHEVAGIAARADADVVKTQRGGDGGNGGDYGMSGQNGNPGYGDHTGPFNGGLGGLPGKSINGASYIISNTNTVVGATV